MGMYTHLVLNANLKEDTPKEVIDTLLYLSYQTEKCTIDEAHALYGAKHIRMVMCGDSYFFDGNTYFRFYFNKTVEEWALTINSNIKNYDEEYQKFLEYICPYITDDWRDKKFLGFIRYEEDEHPTLIYNTENGIEYRKVE